MAGSNPRSRAACAMSAAWSMPSFARNSLSAPRTVLRLIPVPFASSRLLAALVGWARVELGAHSPAQAAAGALTGTLAGGVTFALAIDLL